MGHEVKKWSVGIKQCVQLKLCDSNIATHPASHVKSPPISIEAENEEEEYVVMQVKE